MDQELKDSNDSTCGHSQVGHTFEVLLTRARHLQWIDRINQENETPPTRTYHSGDFRDEMRSKERGEG